MVDFFSSGFAADAIILFMVVEGIVLSSIQRRTRRGIRPMGLFLSLGAGAGLVIALRAALVGAPWPWVAAGITLSLLAHAGDVYFRWSTEK
jgi:hypothetical protein